MLPDLLLGAAVKVALEGVRRDFIGCGDCSLEFNRFGWEGLP